MTYLGLPNASAVKASFKGTELKVVDFPYAAAVISAKSEIISSDSSWITEYFSTVSPRNLFGIKSELLELTTPGTVVNSFSEHDQSLAYSNTALTDFFEKCGGSSIRHPGQFCIEMLAFVSVYLESLPLRLKHVPSIRELSATAQTILDFCDLPEPRRNNDKEIDIVLACAARLKMLFVSDGKKFKPMIHQWDAAGVCEEAFIPCGEDKAISTLFAIYCAVSADRIKADALNQLDDRISRKNLAKVAYEHIRVRKVFPTLSVAGRINTYSGNDS